MRFTLQEVGWWPPLTFLHCLTEEKEPSSYLTVWHCLYIFHLKLEPGCQIFSATNKLNFLTSFVMLKNVHHSCSLIFMFYKFVKIKRTHPIKHLQNKGNCIGLVGTEATSWWFGVLWLHVLFPEYSLPPPPRLASWDFNRTGLKLTFVKSALNGVQFCSLCKQNNHSGCTYWWVDGCVVGSVFWRENPLEV